LAPATPIIVAATTTTTLAAPGVSVGKPSPAMSSGGVSLPEPVKTQDKVVDMKLDWPVPGKAMYLDGKLEGMMIRVKPGEAAKAIASGTVVSAGPSRGFNQVAFIQAKSGYVYVYGGNEALFVKTGDQVVSGKEIGKIGIDAKDGSPIAYFFVFRNGQPIDPALAPRD
jgi:murein DD-endopeptidase MepM/ murein hydrolase activator NlpD